MIINFSNLGSSGGGGGSYKLPIATNEVLGGVRIGEGISVDSGGTISVEDQGIEIVTELPSSGTDGQTVLLIENVPEKIITTVWSNQNVTATTIGVTQKTQIFNYEWYGMRIYVYAMPDGAVQIFNDYNSQTETVDVGNGFVFIMPNGHSNDLYFNVYEGGFTVTANSNIARENIIQDIHQHAEEKEVLYTWSDNEVLTADIDYTTSSSNTWCVRFKYSELPEDTIVVWKYQYDEDYRHLVYEDNQLHIYTSSSADTYTATTYQNVAQYAVVNNRYGDVYWTGDEVIVYTDGGATRVSINEDAFFRIGWHKELEHYVNNKAYYKVPFFYDGDNGVIVQVKDFYQKSIMLNPQYSWGSGDVFGVWTTENKNTVTFYAPVTRGTTDQICVSAGGDNGSVSRPVWKDFTYFTNGVKFWKGSQDDYDALGVYDASTLYIIIPD